MGPEERVRVGMDDRCGMVNMDQQNVEHIVGERLAVFADILGEEGGTIQRKSDRKRAVEIKRIQLSFAAVWEELNELRDRIARIENGVRRPPPNSRVENSGNVTALKNARAS